MLRFEKSLPNLPVPSISSTAAKYLETVRPHVTDTEYTATRKAVDEFVASSHVAELQKRLQRRADGTDSWLSEWWNDAAYMGYRECLFQRRRRDVYDYNASGDPVVVFVSYFYVYLDDKLRRTPEKRAASLLKSLLAFRDLVES